VTGRHPLRRLLPVLVVLLVCALLLPAPCDAKRKKKRKKPRVPPQASFRVVAVLPPHVEIVRERILGGVPKMDESEAVEELLEERIVSELEARGFVVDNSAFAEEALDQDEELRYAMSDLQETYDAELSRILHEPRPERSLAAGLHSLGDPAVAVASIAGVDGLVFVRAQGVSTGGGTKAAAFFLFGGIPGSGLSVIVGLVDGRDGKVVDVAGASKAGAILKNPEKVVGPPLHRAVVELPSAAPATPEEALPPAPEPVQVPDATEEGAAPPMPVPVEPPGDPEEEATPPAPEPAAPPGGPEPETPPTPAPPG
jgi:hypothetical protein